MQRTKLVIADARQDVTQTLSAQFGAVPSLHLSGVFHDLTAIYNMVESNPPDLVIIGESLAVLPEFEVMKLLFRMVSTRCVVLRERAGSKLTPDMLGGVVAVEDDIAPEQLLRLLNSAAEPSKARPEAPKPPQPASAETRWSRLCMIGSSTGGVDALIRVLSRFPQRCPPTLIVQHTGDAFTAGLAQLLDRNIAPKLRLAKDGDNLEAGTILLAPGNGVHLVLDRAGAPRCRALAAPPESGHRPSVDKLFHSGVHVAERVVAVILTGMGRDGAAGMKALREAGAVTIGQDKETSLVYGMPRVAHEIGAVGLQLPIDRIGEAILSRARKVAV